VTRLAVLADIHGNLPALEAVLADLASFPVDHVIVAGDVVNWGPFSAQVMERVTRAGWAVIRGNNEFYLLDYDTPRQPEHWREYVLLPWLCAQLRGRWPHVIAAWPDALSLRFPDAPPIRVVHGSPRSASEPIYPVSTEAEIETMLAGVDETTLIAAHTHLAMDRRVGRWHLLNPGSVGNPLDGLPGASYMLLDGDARGWRATFRRVPFDLEAVLREFERQRFLESYGVTAWLVVEEFKTMRLQVHPFNHWRARHRPAAPLTADLLAEFAKINPWDYTPQAYWLNRAD
jgi:predicted phosphodiesterase